MEMIGDDWRCQIHSWIACSSHRHLRAPDFSPTRSTAKYLPISAQVDTADSEVYTCRERFAQAMASNLRDGLHPTSALRATN